MENNNLNKHNLVKILSLIIVVVFIGLGVFLLRNQKTIEPLQLKNNLTAKTLNQTPDLEEVIRPMEGIILPVTWADLGAQLVKAGVIDVDKFKSLYEERGTFPEEYQKLLLGHNPDRLKITRANAGYLLNLFWALGLANKNSILDQGEMTDPKYGGAGGFASTGGWTMAKGDPMDHYSKHQFFTLNSDQQMLVDKVSRGIYRPCCNNSTHFPDCNHGMAMLGLLELLASQGASEQEMWQTALVVNAYWFPDTYLTIASYFKDQGFDWSELDPKEVLGASYSSSAGSKRIVSLVSQSQGDRGGSSCGV